MVWYASRPAYPHPVLPSLPTPKTALVPAEFNWCMSGTAQPCISALEPTLLVASAQRHQHWCKGAVRCPHPIGLMQVASIGPRALSRLHPDSYNSYNSGNGQRKDYMVQPLKVRVFGPERMFGYKIISELNLSQIQLPEGYKYTNEHNPKLILK